MKNQKKIIPGMSLKCNKTFFFLFSSCTFSHLKKPPFTSLYPHLFSKKEENKNLSFLSLENGCFQQSSFVFFTGEATGDPRVQTGPGCFGPPQKPIAVRSHLLDPPKNPIAVRSHLWDPPPTGTGRPGPGLTGFCDFRSVTMANSGGEEEDWGSADEEEREEGDDDVLEEQASGSRDSAKPILRLPERNDDDTAWTRADGTKPASAKNKLKCEDMGAVRERKDLMWTEVAKNDQDSLVDRWLRDQIKPATCDKLVHAFPQRGQHLTQQNWVRQIEDTKSPVPIRYQQYGILVKLAADKQDKTRATFGTLPKTYPTLWVCCAHRNCMAVYDVTNSNDTQRNIHLAEHHTLGVKAGHSRTSYIPQKIYFWKNGAARSTGTADEPWIASSPQTDVGLRSHLTMRTCTAGWCTRDDDSWQHLDLL